MLKQFQIFPVKTKCKTLWPIDFDCWIEAISSEADCAKVKTFDRYNRREIVNSAMQEVVNSQM